MQTKYGYALDDWNNAKEEMRQILIHRTQIRGRETIPYSELCEKVKTIDLEPDSYALAAMLREISTEEDATGHGMLTVIVCHKGGDMMPGPGWFELAEELGRDTSDPEKCWINELNRVLDYWGTRNPARA